MAPQWRPEFPSYIKIASLRGFFDDSSVHREPIIYDLQITIIFSYLLICFFKLPRGWRVIGVWRQLVPRFTGTISSKVNIVGGSYVSSRLCRRCRRRDTVSSKETQRGCRWLVCQEDEVSRLGTMGYDVRARKHTCLASGDSPSN